jgi:hypothetical protein
MLVRCRHALIRPDQRHQSGQAPEAAFHHTLNELAAGEARHVLAGVLTPPAPSASHA